MKLPVLFPQAFGMPICAFFAVLGPHVPWACLCVSMLYLGRNRLCSLNCVPPSSSQFWLFSLWEHKVMSYDSHQTLTLSDPPSWPETSMPSSNRPQVVTPYDPDHNPKSFEVFKKELGLLTAICLCWYVLTNPKEEDQGKISLTQCLQSPRSSVHEEDQDGHFARNSSGLLVRLSEYLFVFRIMNEVSDAQSDIRNPNVPSSESATILLKTILSWTPMAAGC